MRLSRPARLGVPARLLLLLAATGGKVAWAQGASLNLPRPNILQPQPTRVQSSPPVAVRPVMPPLRIVALRPQQPAKTADVKPFANSGNSAQNVRGSAISPALIQPRGDGSFVLRLD